MSEIPCPQCEKPLTNSTCRLVQDACGHKKCRMCLLQDEESCYQCKQQKHKQTSVITKKNSIDVLECDPVNITNAEAVGQLQNNEIPIKKIVEPSGSGANAINGSVRNVKTAKKAEANAKKRSYQTIVIPSHITAFRDPVSFKCNVCNKIFLTKSHIKYHMYCKGGKCTVSLINTITYFFLLYTCFL